ncbi:hypothetical protein PP707_05130 [Acetobacter pasteurianus]|nr:hypothetical protein [Acetobacter pasteurianus]
MISQTAKIEVTSTRFKVFKYLTKENNSLERATTTTSTTHLVYKYNKYYSYFRRCNNNTK